jgi:hypothetical protein
MDYCKRIDNFTSVSGGLDFCNINFTDEISLKIDCSSDAINLDHAFLLKYISIIEKNKNNNIIKDIGKKVNIDMAFKDRFPITFDKYEDNDEIHEKLSKNLDGIGVIDMWIKKQNSNIIVLPNELKPIKEIITKIYNFESLINRDIFNWNMWLLVDCRPIKKGCTQRNAGFHYDGLNLSGKYAGTEIVSIYGWANKLPTVFYTGKLPNIEELKQYDKNSINMSVYGQMKINNNFIHKSISNQLIKFDGATLHSGDIASCDIIDRVFIRVCFTPPNVWFDRIGNTINSHLQYPHSFKWRKVNDPSTRLINPIFYKNEQEFKNVWDVACLGHHAFCTMFEGKKSYEYQLIKSLRSSKNIIFINNIKKLYDNEKTQLSDLRYRILHEKFFL